MASNWSDARLWTRPVISDAPSGTHVMRTGFNEAQMSLADPPTSFNLSFWVRYKQQTDQAFVRWNLAGIAFTFGVEGDHFRFRLGSNPATSAPEQATYTRPASTDKWSCVEIVGVDSTFQATVTVLGEAPVKLAEIGGAPDPGIDQMMLESVPGGTLGTGVLWVLGDPGADIELDDVRLVGATGKSVCQDFIDANE